MTDQEIDEKNFMDLKSYNNFHELTAGKKIDEYDSQMIGILLTFESKENTFHRKS